MTWTLLPVALAAGIALPVQFGVNSHLRSFVGGPVVAAAISFLVGTLALVVAAPAPSCPRPRLYYAGVMATRSARTT
jgi:transporter family-2 protein